MDEIDNQIKNIKNKQSYYVKQKINKSLVDEMKNRELDCVDLKEKGKLLYTRNKVKSSLSKKHLLSSLATYFKDNDKIVKELHNIFWIREIKIEKTLEKITIIFKPISENYILKCTKLIYD